MGTVYRLATRTDASDLYDIRRRSILELAPPAMPVAEAQVWAAKLTLSGMERKLRELEVWVAELDGVAVGWGAIRGDTLEGLYVAAEFAGQGTGAGLLGMLEGLMRDREFPSVRLEASSNARGFYLRRGYRATGPQTPQGAWPMVKDISPENSGRRRIIAWVAARFWRSFKPFTALDFRPARGDFGARLAGLIGALAAGCQEDIAWRTIRCTI